MVRISVLNRLRSPILSKLIKHLNSADIKIYAYPSGVNCQKGVVTPYGVFAFDFLWCFCISLSEASPLATPLHVHIF